jgi:hypothetical protein
MDANFKISSPAVFLIVLSIFIAVADRPTFRKRNGKPFTLTVHKFNSLCRIWGSHDGGYKEFYFLGYNRRLSWTCSQESWSYTSTPQYAPMAQNLILSTEVTSLVLWQSDALCMATKASKEPVTSIHP